MVCLGAVRLSALCTIFAAVSTTSIVLKADIEGGKQWTYAFHGQDWNQGQCNSRERQSPIDLDSNAPWDKVISPPAVPVPGQPTLTNVHHQFHFNYQILDGNSDVYWQNNGHSLALDVSGNGLGGITFENDWYNLMTMVLHSKSEHQFKGEHADMELHLVHKKYDSGAVIVVALPIIIRDPKDKTDYTDKGAMNYSFIRARGAANPNSPALAAIFDLLKKQTLKAEVPDLKNPKVARHHVTSFKDKLTGLDVAPIDLNALLNENGVAAPGPVVNEEATFFQYHGSLTAPPCHEIAKWMVKRTPLRVEGGGVGDWETLSPVQLFRNIIYENTGGNGNYRSVMPSMGRPIYLSRAILGEPAAVAEGLPAVSKMTTRPFRGDSIAKAAKEAASDAMRSANALGWGLIKSSHDIARDAEQRFGPAIYAPATASNVAGMINQQLAAKGQAVPGEALTPAETEEHLKVMERQVRRIADAQANDAKKEIQTAVDQALMKR